MPVIATPGLAAATGSEPLPPGATLIQDEPLPAGATLIQDEPLPAGATLIPETVKPRLVPAGKAVVDTQSAALHAWKDTAAAHILDAFGQGASDGWGSQPIGLSPEVEKALQ